MAIPDELVDRDAIIVCYRGSIAHGMYVPKSDPSCIDDKDVLICSVPDIDYYFGLRQFGSRGTKERKLNEWDVVTYELRKFVSMLSQGNPNVLSVLWLDENYFVKVTRAGKLLLDNRNLFVGRNSYKSFVGYARGQMHRMTHGACEGYMGIKRKQLVDKFGFDCKNAAHLIRLLRMGVEFLNEGRLYVTRFDAPELLEIKRGEWSLARVEEEAKRLFTLAEEAYTRSTLPVAPDYDAINLLCVQIARMTFDSRNESGAV